MPIDPEISLSAKPAATQFDPLGMALKLGELGYLSANAQTAQQTLAARRALGPIFQQATDPATGEIDYNKALAGAARSPAAAFLVPEISNEVMSRELTKAQLAGQVQGQSNTFLSGLSSDIAASASNPAMLGPLLRARLATAPANVRANMAPAVSGLLDSLTSGLPSDQGQASQIFRQRVAPLLAALPKEEQSFVYGEPTTRDVGGGISSGVQLPAWMGGGYAASGEPIGKTLAPQVAQMPSGPVIVGGPGGGGPSSGAGGSGRGAGALGGAEVSGGAAPTAFDGKPLFSPDVEGPPSYGKGIGGLPIMTQSQNTVAQQMASDFGTTGLKTFNGAQQTLGQLQYMNNALDSMAKSGGLLTPGTWANARTQIAKAANTLAQMTGKDLPFDPNTIADVDSFNKATNQMGTMLTTSLLGQQREAAETISRLTGAVPGIGNSYLGGKVVASGIEATMQRIIDERNFDNAYLQKFGSLIGADTAFAKAHPAQEYARQALDKFGLTADGFTSPQAVKSAVAKGFMTPDQAAQVLHSQFPDQFAAPAKPKE